MTEKEKEIYKFLDDSAIAHEDVTNKELLEVAKALIQRYPQLLSEKVWEGESSYLYSNSGNMLSSKSEQVWHNFSDPIKVEVFIREVK